MLLLVLNKLEALRFFTVSQLYLELIDLTLQVVDDQVFGSKNFIICSEVLYLDAGLG